MHTVSPADRRAQSWLLITIAAIVIGAAALRWHSNLTVDDRTYLEMIQAVSAHGLPYRAGLPVEQFPELRARWHVEHDGRLWSIYPPLFAYVGLPAYRVGGVRGVIRFNVLLLAAIAVGVFGVARRLGGSPAVAGGAAAAAIFATPVWAQAIVVNSAPLAVALVVWSVLVALDAVAPASGDGAGRRGRAALAGFLGGGAIAANLLAVGMIAGLGAAIGAMRGGARRIGLWFCAGVLPWLAVLSLFNRVRFGSFNPVSYGPCQWRSCAETGIDRLTLGAQLATGVPLAAWAACVGAALLMARGSRRRLAAAIAIGCASLLLVPVLRHTAAGMLTIAYALVVDVSVFDLGAGFSRAASGPGVFLDRWVIKSLVQATPFVPVAALALVQGTNDERRRAALVLSPCVALVATLMLRMRLPLAYALGFPFVNERFITFAAPLVVAPAIVVIGRARWNRTATALAAGVACAVAIWFGREADDADTVRRILLLYGSLAIAAVTLYGAARSAQWAPWVAAAAIGYAIAVTLAVDLPAFAAVRNGNDAQLELVARRTPPSFALVGWPHEIDPVLALTATRDIEYADIYEANGFDGIRRLIGWWSARGRPVIALFPTVTPSPWPDVVFQPLGGDGRLVRMIPRGDPNTDRSAPPK
jgi:hypothetical protein